MSEYADKESENEEAHDSEERPFDLKNWQHPAEIAQAKLQARLKGEAFVNPLQKFQIQKQEATPEATSPTPATITSLLIENDALPAAGQMRKSEFLGQLNAHVCQVVEEVLADTPYSSDNCPYLRRIFARHEQSTPAQIEEILHRYAPQTQQAQNAQEVMLLIGQRTRQVTLDWAQGNGLSGLPLDILSMLPTQEEVDAGQGAHVGTGIQLASRSLYSLGRIFSSAVGGIFRKARSKSSVKSQNPAAVMKQLGAGQKLGSHTRNQMEGAFGSSFSQVEVHTDQTAVQLATDMNARAFTVGSHIAFGSGEYRPGTLLGDALLAHELAHVEQQKGASMQAQTKLEMGEAAYNALEQDADETAVGVMGAIWGTKKSSYGRGKKRPGLKTGVSLRRCSLEPEVMSQFGHTRTDSSVSGRQLGEWQRSTDMGLISHTIIAGEKILHPESQAGAFEENFSSLQTAAAYAHTVAASRHDKGACIIQREGQYQVYLIEMNPSPPFTRAVLEHEGGLASSRVLTTGAQVSGIVNFVTSDGFIVPINHTIRDQPNRLDPDAIRTSDIELSGYQQVLQDIRSGRATGLSSEGYVALFRGMLRANAVHQLRENKQKLDQEQAKYQNDQSTNREWIRLRQIIRQDKEIKQREDRLSTQYTIQHAALARLEELLPEWEASSNPMVRSQLETFRTMRVNLTEEVGRLRNLLDEARQGRARLRLEYPPLSVIQVEDVSDSTQNSVIFGRIVAGFNEIRGVIDDVITRIHEDDIPLSKLGHIVTQTKDQMGVTDERRQQGDPLSVAVTGWLSSQDTTEAIITWTGTILSLVLGVAAIIASGGWAIFLGLAGSAIGLGTAVYEFERAEDLYAASRAGEATGGHLVDDPETARFNYIMGWVNLLLAGLDLGIAARAASVVWRGGRIAEELAGSLGGGILRRLRPEQITHFDEAMRLRRAGDLEGAQRILDRLRTQLGDEVFTQAESLFNRSSKVQQLFGSMHGVSEEARRALVNLDEAILDRLPSIGSTSIENIGQFIRRNGTEAAAMLNRMGDSALGIVARGGREADLLLDLHTRILRKLPASATTALDASALIRLSDPAVVRQLESAISLQESRRLAGLEDWIRFNGRKAATEFEDALLELREAQRLAAAHPDEVVHLGMEVHAPTYPGTTNPAPQFDLAARDASGAIVRSVEMTRIRSLIQSADDSVLTEAVRHAADKAAVRHGIGIPVEGTLEASIEMGIDVGVSEGRTRVTRLADGTVTIARPDTGAVFRTTNIFDDFARRISSILNSQFLDRINLLDNGGNILAIYERRGAGWSRIR